MPCVDEAVIAEIVTIEPDSSSPDWRSGLPTLTGHSVALRELRLGDANSLFESLATEQVGRFISPSPVTIEGFERFIVWTLRQRAAGNNACFAVTLRGNDTAIGIFQVRDLQVRSEIAEWGFAIASPFWGTGVFQESAELVLAFIFETLGIHRLEARAAVKNCRGLGALRKIGAVQEALLRQSLLRNGERLDQQLWSILHEDWRRRRYAH